MRRRTIRWTVRILVATSLVLGLFIALRWTTGNFGTVEPDRIYRAAQLSPSSLARTIEQSHIKTVLNLRGANHDQAWYRQERQATLAAGATQVDFPMSSDQWLSIEQVRTLLEILDKSEYPILIHCEWGAERTGLVSAICELIRPGSTIDDARGEFSPYYMFLPIKDGLVMRGHLDRYRSWLDQIDSSHSPGTFRHWLLSDYRPGSPSRQYWECNPYPLKVVSRPGTESVTQWGEKKCPPSTIR